MFSTITIASSTNIPIEKISANKEIRLSVKPYAHDAKRVIVKVTVIATPTIIASRQPIVNNTRRITPEVAKMSFVISRSDLLLAVSP